LKGRLNDLTYGLDGKQRLTVALCGDFREQYAELADADVEVTVKKFRKRRSLDANAFCWQICTDIGNAISPPLTKEDVYRRAIRAVGVYEPLPIKECAVESFQRRWADKGVGWFADVIDDSKLDGYKLVFAYYGSSTYDSKEMATLIDYLVDDAKQMGLNILTASEIALMKEEWAKS